MTNKARKIFYEKISDWGDDRHSYHATVEEIQIFLQHGAKIVVLNQNNKDNSFRHEVIYQSKRFIASTEKEVKFIHSAD